MKSHKTLASRLKVYNLQSLKICQNSDSSTFSWLDKYAISCDKFSISSISESLSLVVSFSCFSATPRSSSPAVLQPTIIRNCSLKTYLTCGVR